MLEIFSRVFRRSPLPSEESSEEQASSDIYATASELLRSDLTQDEILAKEGRIARVEELREQLDERIASFRDQKKPNGAELSELVEDRVLLEKYGSAFLDVRSLRDTLYESGDIVRLSGAFQSLVQSEEHPELRKQILEQVIRSSASRDNYPWLIPVAAGYLDRDNTTLSTAFAELLESKLSPEKREMLIRAFFGKSAAENLTDAIAALFEDDLQRPSLRAACAQFLLGDSSIKVMHAEIRVAASSHSSGAFRLELVRAFSGAIRTRAVSPKEILESLSTSLSSDPEAKIRKAVAEELGRCAERHEKLVLNALNRSAPSESDPNVQSAIAKSVSVITERQEKRARSEEARKRRRKRQRRRR